MTLAQKDFENDFKVEGDWAADIAEMHTKFGVNKAIRALDDEKLKAFLQFRIDFLQEELNEMKACMDPDYKKPESRADDVVDALVDLLVVALGTLNAFDVDAYEAWARVRDANMTKSPGIKPGRKNEFSLPDLIKPENFKSPTHADNVGLLSRVFK